MTFVALLRGINVGGNNPVPMADLREMFEAEGATNVRTYIQSGNVVFDGGKGSSATWTTRLEAALSERFGYDATLVVISDDQLRAVVDAAPEGFGSDPGRYRCDVIFLMPDVTAEEALAQVSIREGVDEATAGRGVLYFSRLEAQRTKSRLSKFASAPVYKRVTIRNWRTTTTLLRMLGEETS